MAKQTDAQLVERARQGEHAALAELFRRYWRAARAAACVALGDLNLAEDAASEALTAAMTGLKSLKEPEKFAPWLHTIVVRTAKQSKQARLKRQHLERKKPGPNTTDSPETNLEHREWIELLRGAVEQLPPKQREAIMLFYFFKDGQGIWRSMMEMSQLEQRPNEEIWKTAGLSDMVVLQWIQLESLELRAVEQRLRTLLDAVVPQIPFSLEPYSSPRYRSALRLQFGGSTLPAVIGGVLEPWPELPDHSHAGMLVLCLEAWAGAKSGQDIPMGDAKPFLDLMTPKNSTGTNSG